MTPHARKFSLFQASLKASSAAAASSQASDSAAPSPKPDNHGTQQHRQYDDDHELHEHEHQKPHRHSHYLPLSRGSKSRNGGANVVQDSKPADTPAADNNYELRRRQIAGSGTLVTEVIQTISVVQVMDGNGDVVTLQTLYSPPVTQVLDSDGATVDSTDYSYTQALAADTPAAAKTAGASGTVGQTSNTAGTGSAATTPATGATGTTGAALFLSSSSTTSQRSLATALTGAAANTSTSVTEPFTNATSSTAVLSVPLTTGPLTTLLPTTYNSTAAHIYTNSSLQHTLFANTSRTSTTSTRLHTSSSSSSVVVSTASSALAGGATGAGGVGGAGGATAGTAPAATTSSDSDSNSSTGTPTSVLVGSVIGGLAGLAVLLIVAMFLLRWKRKRGTRGHKLLGDDDNVAGIPGGAVSRAVLEGGSGAAGAAGTAGPGGGGGPSSGPSGGMTESRTAFLMPFASAFAAGQKRLSRGTTSTGTGTFASEASSGAAGGSGSAANTDRSFYRVSGKKLPSVLQHGGDGYEDPRESMLSVSTSLYRDSRGFFGGAGGPATTPVSRYAVGSPMRPESGVPIFQPGPGKAVAMEAPSVQQGSSAYDRTASVRIPTPPPGIDAIGRSMPLQDNSRGSASRFTEDIL